jgi:hypothetical protein
MSEKSEKETNKKKECPIPKKARDQIKEVSDLVRKHRDIIEPFLP